MPHEARIQCPHCHGQLEWSPDQGGACDCECMQCGWSEHVPSSGKISAALISHKENQLGSKPSVELQLLTEREIDLKLLEQQAAILGKVVDKASLTGDERSCLEGLWECVHRIIDRMEATSEPETSRSGLSATRTRPVSSQ